jgi:hypothetical protein
MCFGNATKVDRFSKNIDVLSKSSYPKIAYPKIAYPKPPPRKIAAPCLALFRAISDMAYKQ